MTTDERLAQLRERRGVRTGPPAGPLRRRHAAASGRILAAGLSASALFGLTAVLATQDGADAGEPPTGGTANDQLLAPPPTAPAPAAEPTLVVIVQRRTVYVDEHGRPLDPAVAQARLAALAAPPPPAPAPVAAVPTPVVQVAPRPAPPPPPRCSGSKCP